MTYRMTITKDFGNRKSATVEVKAENKVDAMFRGLAKLGRLDWHNFKWVQHWQVIFTNVEKIA